MPAAQVRLAWLRAKLSPPGVARKSYSRAMLTTGLYECSARRSVLAKANRIESGQVCTVRVAIVTVRCGVPIVQNEKVIPPDKLRLIWGSGAKWRKKRGTWHISTVHLCRQALSLALIRRSVPICKVVTVHSASGQTIRSLIFTRLSINTMWNFQ